MFSKLVLFSFIIFLWCALGLMVCPQATFEYSTLCGCVKMLFSQLCCLPLGQVLLNVSVLCHLNYELIYFLFNVFIYYVSGEVSFFYEFLYYMVSCSVIPFRPGPSCSAKI